MAYMLASHRRLYPKLWSFIQQRFQTVHSDLNKTQNLLEFSGANDADGQQMLDAALLKFNLISLPYIAVADFDEYYSALTPAERGNKPKPLSSHLVAWYSRANFLRGYICLAKDIADRFETLDSDDPEAQTTIEGSLLHEMVHFLDHRDDGQMLAGDPGKAFEKSVYGKQHTRWWDDESDETAIATFGSGASGTTAAPVATTRDKHIEINETDLDALARVAYSEVGHFGKYGEAQLRGGIAAVVDTIINRTAHPRHPNTILKVVDQPKQFSAINEVHSWFNLKPAPDSIMDIIVEHLTDRTNGQASEILGATHFLNPFYSSITALEEWGNYLVDNHVAFYGNVDAKDVHYHGFPPAAVKPPAHVIVFRGADNAFSGAGRNQPTIPVVATASHSDIRRKIVEVCRGELARFDYGQAKEFDDPQYLRVGDYWDSISSGYDGRTKGADGTNPAWSAAFVSFVLREAGAGDRFPGSQAHCHYFQHFVDRAGANLYEALRSDQVTPRPGDILHYGRRWAKQYNFSTARQNYAADSFYPSHSDIIVAVDANQKVVKAIGGNISNSVKEKTFHLDENGRLVERVVEGQTYPWIGLLRMT